MPAACLSKSLFPRRHVALFTPLPTFFRLPSSFLSLILDDSRDLLTHDRPATPEVALQSACHPALHCCPKRLQAKAQRTMEWTV